MHIQHGDYPDAENGQCTISPYFPAPFAELAEYGAIDSRMAASNEGQLEPQDIPPIFRREQVARGAMPIFLASLTPKARSTLFTQYFLGGYYVTMLGGMGTMVSIPALLLALQVLPKIYGEALKIFFDVTDFWIKPSEMQFFLENVKATDLESLRKMTFNFSPFNARHPKDPSDPRGMIVPLAAPFPEHNIRLLISRTMLREVTIVIGLAGIEPSHILRLLRSCKDQGSPLQRLNLRIGQEDLELVEQINELLNISGKTERVSGWTSKLQWTLTPPRRVETVFEIDGENLTPETVTGIENTPSAATVAEPKQPAPVSSRRLPSPRHLTSEPLILPASETRKMSWVNTAPSRPPSKASETQGMPWVNIAQGRSAFKALVTRAKPKVNTTPGRLLSKASDTQGTSWIDIAPSGPTSKISKTRGIPWVNIAPGRSSYKTSGTREISWVNIAPSRSASKAPETQVKPRIKLTSSRPAPKSGTKTTQWIDLTQDRQDLMTIASEGSKAERKQQQSTAPRRPVPKFDGFPTNKRKRVAAFKREEAKVENSKKAESNADEREAFKEQSATNKKKIRSAKAAGKVVRVKKVVEVDSDEERPLRRKLGFRDGHYEKNNFGFWFVDTWFWEAKAGDTLFHAPLDQV